MNGGSGTQSSPASNIGANVAGRRVILSLLSFPFLSFRTKSSNHLPFHISQGSNSSTLFSGLINQKRNSTDAAAQARRQSFNEMKPQPGILGNMWNKYVLVDSHIYISISICLYKTRMVG